MLYLTMNEVHILRKFNPIIHKRAVCIAAGQKTGLLAPDAMGSLLTGIRPLSNVVSLICFAFYASEHKENSANAGAP